MSQKKARRNRLRKLNQDVGLLSRELASSPETGKIVMMHILWSLPQEELKARLEGAGPEITIEITDKGDFPGKFTIKAATEDALKVISEDVDDELIIDAAMEFSRAFHPLLSDGYIATLSIDDLDGTGHKVAFTFNSEAEIDDHED
jgi:hypothetical protein